MKRVGILFWVCSTCGLALAQTHPVPFVNQPLVPMSAAPGGPSFTLTVNGAGFLSSSVVQWNGTGLPTTFVNGSELKATVAASHIAAVGTAAVTVATSDGGISNTQYFGISDPVSIPTFSSYYDFALQPLQNTFNLSAITADFNGDGKPDLAQVDGYRTLAVQLGNGDGSFQVPVTYTSLETLNCSVLSSPVVGDFNGDGKLDIAVPACGGVGALLGNVDIFLGNGDGSFQAATNFPTAYAPYYIVVGDFNGDGKLDIATANSNGGASTFSLSVLLGNGDGTFQNHVDYASQVANPRGMVVGDFNQDGKLDVAYADRTTGIWIYAGNGDGTFSTPTQLVLSGFEALGLITADVNGDGKLDLIALGNSTTLNTNAAYVYLGNGDGTFQAAVSYEVPNYPNFITVGDVNADGKLDLAITDNLGAGSVSILLGNGDGSFQSASILPTGLESCDFGTFSVALGDFNGDGAVDIAAPNSTECYDPYPNLTVLLQGTLPAAVMLPSTLTFSQQAVGTTSASQSVTLTNTGKATLSISSVGLAGTNVGDYAETDGCGDTLGPDASCQIGVTFTPMAGGTRGATLSVATNSAGSPQIVPLSGTTPPAPAVTLLPLAVTFPGQYVGTSGLPQTVTLTNTGTAVLTISNVSTSTADFSVLSGCGSSVAAGSSCSLGVFFDPSAVGTRTATLTVTDNAGDSPQAVSLSGLGEDFSMASSGASSVTVSPGQTANYTISIAPGGGFQQSVSLSCSGAPAHSICSLSANSVQLNSSSSTTVNVAVSTAGTSARVTDRLGARALVSRLAVFLAFVLPGLTLVGLRRGPSRAICGLVLLGLLAAGLSACGSGSGNSGGGTGGTLPGNYTISVTGTFSASGSSLTHTTNLTLIVRN